MSMTIPQALAFWQHRLGRSIHIPRIPPACARLMDQARAAGIPVGTLYIVSRPLASGTLGSYDWDTGDLCCHYEASRGEEGQREVLQTLLILLAGLKLHAKPAQTIAGEWDAVRQAIEEGYALAQQWGYASLFTTDDLTRLLTRSVELASGHHLAAELAGNRLPWVARNAYAALQMLCQGMPELTTQEHFAEALQGVSAHPQVNDLVVSFDRSQLRERWVPTATRQPEERVSFGEATVPVRPQSTHALRVALSRAAAWTGEPLAERDKGQFSYQNVCDEADLATLIRMINSWLIETHPQAAVRLQCWVYGDGYRRVTGSPCIYRLFLSYDDAPVQGPGTRDLWVLFAESPKDKHLMLEGAWQLFLASWLTWSSLEYAPLSSGLQLLWMLEGGQL